MADKDKFKHHRPNDDDYHSFGEERKDKSYTEVGRNRETEAKPPPQREDNDD